MSSRFPGWLRALGDRLTGGFHKIRTELFFSYFVVILLCVTLVGAVSYYYSGRAATRLAENANEQIVNQIQISLDQDFQRKRDLLLAPYFDSVYINGIANYNSMGVHERYLFSQKLGDLYLKMFYVSPRNDFVRFSIYYSDGEMLYTSGSRATARMSAEEAWFRNTVARDGRIYFSGSYEDPQSEGRRLYSASLLIRDYSTEDEYMVVRAEYNFKLLENISRSANISENSRIVLFDRNGGVVFVSEPGDGENGGGAWHEHLFERLGQGGDSFWYEGDGGEKMQITHLPSQIADWEIVLATPQRDIMGNAETIKSVTIMTVGLAFVVTLLLSAWFAGRLTRPILKLHQTVNRIKRGDLSIRVHINSRNELGRIAVNFNAMVDDLQELIQSKYLYRLKLQEAELAALYSQINPHFLYNTLDSIRAMSEYYDIRDVASMSSALADMLRYNTRKDREWVTVRDEIGQVRDYLTIQKIRFGDKIRADWQVEDHLWEARLLKMTLQPLVENAVFHGLERKKGGGRLHIRVMEDNGNLRLDIVDDGIGMNRRSLEKIRKSLQLRRRSPEDEPFHRVPGDGIGLSNVYTRYVIRYGSDFAFDMDSAPEKGTTVTIRIPLTEKKASENSTLTSQKREFYPSENAL